MLKRTHENCECLFYAFDGNSYIGRILRVRRGIATVEYKIPQVGNVITHLGREYHNRLSIPNGL